MTLALVLHQARYDALGFLRNRQARHSTTVMPLILLTLLTTAFGDHAVGHHHVKASTYYVPGICTLAVLAACFANLAISVTTQRENGVLKRRRATPVPAIALIGGRALTAIAVSLGTVTAVCALGAAGFGVYPRPAAIPTIALSCLIAAASFCCLAYALSPFIRSADSAQPIVQAIMLPLYFASGVFIPSANLPSWLQSAAQLLPVAHLSHALHGAFDPARHGSAIPWVDLAVLVAWGTAGLAVALTRFRWTASAVSKP